MWTKLEQMNIFKKLWTFSGIFQNADFKKSERLLDGFEPIVSNFEVVERIQTRKYGKHYIFPLLISLYLTIESLVLLYLYGNDKKNPVIFHQVVFFYMPEVVVDQADEVLIYVFSLAVVVYYFLLFDRMTHAKYLMFLSHNTPGVLQSLHCKEPNQSLVERLMKFWLRVKPKMDLLLKMMDFEVNFALTGPMIVSEIYREIYRPNHRTYYRLWCCVMLIVVFLYYFVRVIHMGNYFIITNFYINIKQKYYLNLVSYLTTMRNYRHFDYTLKKCLMLTDEINGFNRFFSRYISIIVLCYCLIGASIINASKLATKETWIPLYSWAFLGVCYMALIILTCSISSRTMLLNKQIFLKVRSLQISLCNNKATFGSRRIVHLDLANEYKTLLLKSCFRVANSTPLNNRLFYFEIFGFVSIVFLKSFGAKKELIR